MVSSLQKSMINLTQVLRLREHQKSFKELEKLGAIDVYYLEAIYQLKEPTIGTISKLLGQSTPNTNYHIKKLVNLKLIEKRIDDVDRRVTHLTVTSRYSELINSDEDFWTRTQERLESEIAATDLAIFQRVLRQTIEIISEESREDTISD
ncbi:MarR family winged helix-turn-helix transcriptional regulator [Ligilactobacillus sp. WILCCON 0076]|uniref:MarR family winged helix-turn-helix transcriptional regulator n=1 Tax=Ligilactobacillus ubinensis TaxID=2876789 RepID=A0A9X2FGV9_9LACO|nr:MarR family transcriptional regulator [Ligilactobacillus ubinensis]MCP0886097.1 MarR family winged helix-turn-helix transcriptional regulator [Ligilactobacillus ubinensis]